MIDIRFFINFFFLFTILMFFLKVLTGGTLPMSAVMIPLLLFVGTLFIGSKT